MSDSISIVIPAYNAEASLTHAVESLFSQTRPPDEIIIVDDGSTDNTQEMARGFGEKIKYIRQENGGVSRARNIGIANATGEWIGFLDADDEYLENHLSDQMAILDAAPAIKWCAGNFILAGNGLEHPRTPIYRIRGNTTATGYFSNYFLSAAARHCYVNSSTALLHRSIPDEIGGFEEGRRVAEDVDFWWRIAHRYPSIGYEAEPITRVNLDSGDETFGERRLYSKSGKDIREIVARHLELAKAHGDEDAFANYASVVLMDRLPEMIYNGFADEARETVRQFAHLLPLSWRVGCRALTAFPKSTKTALHLVARIANDLKGGVKSLFRPVEKDDPIGAAAVESTGQGTSERR
jgi:glycosyltransferase involved in cell wall biosynthesis